MTVIALMVGEESVALAGDGRSRNQASEAVTDDDSRKVRRYGDTIVSVAGTRGLLDPHLAMAYFADRGSGEFRDSQGRFEESTPEVLEALSARIVENGFRAPMWSPLIDEFEKLFAAIPAGAPHDLRCSLLQRFVEEKIVRAHAMAPIRRHLGTQHGWESWASSREFGETDCLVNWLIVQSARYDGDRGCRAQVDWWTASLGEVSHQRIDRVPVEGRGLWVDGAEAGTPINDWVEQRAPWPRATLDQCLDSVRRAVAGAIEVSSTEREYPYGGVIRAVAISADGRHASYSGRRVPAP